MKHPRPKKQPKAPAKTKITGKVSSFNAQHIALQTAKGVVWKIDKTPNTKVTGTLKRGSTVTVEFGKKDGRQIGKIRYSPPRRVVRNAGKRTELQTGTVIGLTAQWINLQTANDGTWNISRTDGNTKITAGTLALHSDVTIQFLVPPGQTA